MTQESIEIASASYRLTTDGRISKAYPWQNTLYVRLSALESDAGYLLTTPTGAGKTEAVVIPSLGLRRGGAPRRLFIIGPDTSPLDDYVHRLVPYLRSSAIADEVPRTFYLDADRHETEEDQCTRFFPDGTVDTTLARNPLEADVDLVLTSFSRFHEMFFGGGGIHGLPSSLPLEDLVGVRRDLFFFDEAHCYSGDGFARFHRLVEFLFAQDMDIVVGSSTMPAQYQEELSYLELVQVHAGENEPARTLNYISSRDILDEMEKNVRQSYDPNARIFAVLDTAEQAETLYNKLASLNSQSVFFYDPNQKQDSRLQTYGQLRNLEKQDKGYLLITTGHMIEVSNLDADVLITALCPPENLIRRAGRCNRYGKRTDSKIIVIGDQLPETSRPLNTSQAADYFQSLKTQNQTPYRADLWKTFI
jgi:CRISPR-associated endonuclease/helicase Cas3